MNKIIFDLSMIYLNLTTPNPLKISVISSKTTISSSDDDMVVFEEMAEIFSRFGVVKFK